MPRSAVPKNTIDLIMSRNIRRLREERGMSQAALALRMRESGFAFTPATVSKVEQLEDGSQQRRVSAAELVAFAQIFDAELNELTVPTFGGSDVLKRTLALGRSFDAALQEVVTRASRALTVAEAFRRAHDRLVADGEFDSAAAPPEYTELVAKLGEELLNRLYRLQPSHRTSGLGEWTTASGTDFEFQASSESANRSWEFGDKDEVFDHFDATGESLIADFDIRS